VSRLHTLPPHACTRVLKAFHSVLINACASRFITATFLRDERARVQTMTRPLTLLFSTF